MKKIILAISLLLILPLMLGTPTALGGESSGVGKIRTAIETANKKFLAAFNRGDAAGVAACYTADARLLPPELEMMKGRQAIQSFWQGAMDSGVKKAELETVEVEAREDMAYEIGKYTLTIQPPEGEAITARGKYLVVWKHQAGTWKLDFDIWNSTAPTGK